MAVREFLFTSESVTEGHPDKVADQISDAVLDAVLADDRGGRVACETLITTGLVVVGGEITTEIYVDISNIVRDTVRRIGYTDSEVGFDANTCGVVVAIDPQSPDIAQGIDASYEVQHDPGDDDPLDRVGAGDQGMMFGYATNETPELMPLPIMLAHKVCRRLAGVRKSEQLKYLRPDGKAQVTVRYEVDDLGRQRPVEIVRILVSTQHADGVDAETIKEDVIEHVLHPVLPRELYDERRFGERDFVYVNPTGKFVLGGPMGDTGLTGRKISVDTYGGAARRRRVLGEGSDQGRPLGGVRGALRGEERRRRRARRPLRGERRVRDRRRASGLDRGADVQHRAHRRRPHRGARARPLRPAAGRDPARPRPAPPDLLEDRRVRALRPGRPRLHVGTHGQGRRAARVRRRYGRNRSPLTFT